MKAKVNTSAVTENQLVWTSTASTQTKAQKDFNEALNKHKLAVKKSKEIDDLVVLAVAEYHKIMNPEIEKQNTLIKERTEMLCYILVNDVIKLSKNEKQALKDCLLNICNDEMDEDRDFYLNVLKQLETTAERNHRILQKQRIEKEIKEKFGFDVDLDELHKKTFANQEEEMAHKLKFKDFFEKVEEGKQQEYESFFDDQYQHQNKKQSKTQFEKERKLAEAEKLLNTDINKLFKDLAKLIHPDRELDPEMRHKKENLMKELSNARDNADIGDILRIKLLVDELLPNNNNELSLTDTTIKRFVTVLKTKIKELEDTIYQKIVGLPFLNNLSFKNINQKNVFKAIQNQHKEITDLNKDLLREINYLKKQPKYIKTIIEEYIYSDHLIW